MARKKRFEISTVGPDADLQLVGSDALRGSGWTGLPIPSAVPLTVDARYTFLVAIATFGVGEFARLVGLRQLVEIGCYVASGGAFYPLKRLVETPTWRFVDGNIMWSLRRILPFTPGFFNVANADALQWRMGPAPAQLFETLPVGAPILPPFRGLLPGESLEPNLTQFYDLRFPWVDDNAPDVLDCPIVGPCAVALFASVLQTNPVSRLKLPGAPGTFTVDSGITPEDAFVGNNPHLASEGGVTNTGAQYTRITGSLLFKMDVPERTVPEERKPWVRVVTHEDEARLGAASLPSLPAVYTH